MHRQASEQVDELVHFGSLFARVGKADKHISVKVNAANIINGGLNAVCTNETISEKVNLNLCQREMKLVKKSRK